MLTLEARRVAGKEKIELAMFQAWQTGRLVTFSKKLKSLPEFMRELRSEPRKAQTPAEMLAAMRAVKASVH